MIGSVDTTSARDTNINTKKILLLTGFGPWGNFATNPSYESIRNLDGKVFNNYIIKTVEVPVVWDEAFEVVKAKITQYNPSIIIATGVAGSRNSGFYLETTAVNQELGTDNKGINRFGTPCLNNGPQTLKTRLPLDELSRSLKNASIPYATSNSAGTFLCNHLFYNLLYYVDETVPVGFIHVSNSAGYSLEKLTEGWIVILTSITQYYN